MKIETLKERIEKTTENIEKTKGTIERHKTQADKKAKAAKAAGVDLNDYDKYDRTKIDHDTYWLLCEYEGKMEDLKNNEKKLADYVKTLKGLQKQLEDQLAQDNEIESQAPAVLNEFLENWKQKATKFYIDLATRYLKLIKKEASAYKLTREELEQLTELRYNAKTYRRETVKMYTAEQIENLLSKDARQHEKESAQYYIRQQHIGKFVNSHFASDMAIAMKITEHKKLDMKLLNKILDDDVKVKRTQFMLRIKEVIGDIKDLKFLHISPKGEINGIAKGVKCDAKVETITAGGYNIQCFHYRVLVNAVR